MTGPCPNCRFDPGFDWGICPQCGMTPDRMPRAAAGQASNAGRWDPTEFERGPSTPDRPRRVRPDFAGDEDFFEPIPRGEARDERLRWGSGRASQPPEDDDEADYTIMDRGDHGHEEDDDDHTMMIRHGRRGAIGPLAYVVQRNGVRAGRVFRLGAETVLGRKPGAENREVGVTIADETVSRRHAKIRYENGRFVYWDLASANGSYVVGADRSRTQILAPLPLDDGQTIELGDVRVTFLEVDNAGSF